MEFPGSLLSCSFSQNYCNTTGIKKTQIKNFSRSRFFILKKIPEKISKKFPARNNHKIYPLRPFSPSLIPLKHPLPVPLFPGFHHRQSGPYTGSDVRLFLNGALYVPGLGSADPLFDAIHLVVFCKEGVRSISPSEIHFTDGDPPAPGSIDPAARTPFP